MDCTTDKPHSDCQLFIEREVERKIKDVHSEFVDMNTILSKLAEAVREDRLVLRGVNYDNGMITTVATMSAQMDKMPDQITEKVTNIIHTEGRKWAYWVIGINATLTAIAGLLVKLLVGAQ